MGDRITNFFHSLCREGVKKSVRKMRKRERGAERGEQKGRGRGEEVEKEMEIKGRKWKKNLKEERGKGHTHIKRELYLIKFRRFAYWRGKEGGGEEEKR